MGGVVEKITKPIRKIIPKEIRPILPIAAAFLPIPGAGALGSALAKTGLNPLVQAAIKKGIISAGVQGITEGKVDPFKTAVSGIAGGLAETGAAGLPSFLQKAPDPLYEEMGAKSLSVPEFLTSKAGELAQTGAVKVAEAAAASPFKTATAASGIVGAKAAVDEQQRLLDEYNRSLTESNVTDNSERIRLIKQYMGNAGFDESQIQSALTRYGYLANGGRVGYQMGGDVSYTDFGRSGVIYRDPQGNPISKEEFLSQTDEMGGIPSIRMKDKEPTREDILQSYADSDTAVKLLEKMVKEGKVSQKDYDRMMRIEKDMTDIGNLDFSNYKDKKELRQAEKDIMQKDQKITDLDKQLLKILENPVLLEKMLRENYENKANGGIISLMGGGMPAMEMDYRGGGFIPVGSKERADDVPARLSKNEFVFTADAVRAAGGGSVQKGAQKMYNTMKMLEGKLA